MTGLQIVEFSNVVRPAFTVSELTTLLRTLNKEFTDYAPAAELYPKQVELVIAAANSLGWIKQLVVAFLDARPANHGMRQFIQANPDFDPARLRTEHPCDTLQIFGGQCFIGRPDLRKFLKDMDTEIGRKVLIVTSDHRRVGKSYTKELVDFLSLNQQGTSRVVPVDLDRKDYDSGALALELGKALGLDPGSRPPQGDQQPTRWNQELVEWLIPQVPNPAATTVWWIILDGFRLKIPSEAVHDLISQLAQRVKSTTRYRLVLLNYATQLPLAVVAFGYKDNVQPLVRAEVADYLAKVHERKHGAPPQPPQLDEYVDSVYELRAKYALKYPEAADDLLLLNMAVSDATLSI